MNIFCGCSVSKLASIVMLFVYIHHGLFTCCVGNGGSLDKCRRRWDLPDNETLKYKYMNAFDRAMNHLDKAFGFINSEHSWVSRQDEGDKMIICERGDLIFVFNFHPTQSYTDYRIGCNNGGSYKV